jgi:hypothetical protein
MTTVQEIELAVKSLHGNDLKEFRDWFYHFDEQAWDQKISKDQRDENSAIAKLARKALISHRNGKSTQL